MIDPMAPPEEEIWTPPKGAVSIVIWNMSGRYGYVFLSEPLKQIGNNAFTGKQTNGLNVLLIGLEHIERPLPANLKSLDEALWGIYKASDFEIKQNTSSEKPKPYTMYFSFKKTNWRLEDDKMPEVIDSNTIRIYNLGNPVIYHSQDIRLFCYQNSKDDSDYFDFDNLPQIVIESPIKTSA